MANDLQEYVLFLLEFRPSCIKQCYLFDLSANPNITLDFVLANPKLNWDFSGLSMNPNITWDMICQNFSMSFPIYTRYTAKNPNITIDIIEKNLNLKWEFPLLVYNPSISPEELETLVIKVNKNRDKYNNILNVPNHINYPTDKYNENITVDFVKQRPEHRWILGNLAVCPLITLDILNYVKPTNDQEKNNFFNNYSKNPSLTVQNIIDNVKENWNPSNLASNPAFDIGVLKQIESILNKPIRQNTFITKNPNITLDILNNDNTITTDVVNLGMNPNLTYLYLKPKFTSDINKISELFKNELTFNKYVYNRKIRENISAKVIIITQLTLIILSYV